MLSKRYVLQAGIGRGEEIKQIVRVYHPFPQLKKLRIIKQKKGEKRAHMFQISAKAKQPPNEIARQKRHIWTIKPYPATITPISKVICVP